MNKVATVLWYEDTQSWLNTARIKVERRIEPLGLEIVYDHDFLAFNEIVFNIGYDIALIDRTLSNGLIGSHFIHELRKHGCNTPVIYYTQAPDIDLQKEVVGLEGVTCVLREELVNAYLEFLQEFSQK